VSTSEPRRKDRGRGQLGRADKIPFVKNSGAKRRSIKRAHGEETNRAARGDMEETDTKWNGIGPNCGRHEPNRAGEVSGIGLILV